MVAVVNLSRTITNWNFCEDYINCTCTNFQPLQDHSGLKTLEGTFQDLPFVSLTFHDAAYMAETNFKGIFPFAKYI